MNKIIGLIDRNIMLVIVITLLNSTTSICLIGNNGSYSNMMKFLAQEMVVFVWSIVFICMFKMLKNYSIRLAKLIEIFMISVMVILFIIDFFLILKYNSILDQAKIEIILGTNPITIKEFLQQYVLSWKMIVVSAAAIISFFVCMKLKPVISSFIRFKVTTKPMAYVMLVGAAFGLLSICFTFFRYGVAGVFDKVVYRSMTFNRVIVDTCAAINDLGNEDDINASFNNSDEKVISNDSNVPYVIFVLGESADRNKMSAYGYHNKTTPVLDDLISRGEVVLFDDTIAPANYTQRAMELIFTFAAKEDKNHWYENQNIIDIAKACEYRTIWLSNQSPVGKYGNMDRILANRSDYARFTNIEGGATSSLVRPLDETLLPLLDEAMVEDTEKNFYVLHIEGSHEVFNIRYPKNFEKFSAQDEDTENETWNVARAEYDNTILYTDFILQEIIKRFSDKNAVLIYISDHGNEVYDGRNFVGHSSEEDRNRHMVEVPMFVWGSQKYWTTHPQIKAAIRNGKDKPFMTDDMIFFLEDIMQIKSSSYKPERSVINSLYVPKKRIYGGTEYIRND